MEEKVGHPFSAFMCKTKPVLKAAIENKWGKNGSLPCPVRKYIMYIKLYIHRFVLFFFRNDTK